MKTSSPEHIYHLTEQALDGMCERVAIRNRESYHERFAAMIESVRQATTPQKPPTPDPTTHLRRAADAARCFDQVRGRTLDGQPIATPAPNKADA